MTQLNIAQGAYPVYILRSVPAGFGAAREVQSPAPGKINPRYQHMLGPPGWKAAGGPGQHSDGQESAMWPCCREG